MTLPSRLGLKNGLDAWAALLVALAPLAYFHQAVLGRFFLSPDDGVLFNIPLRMAAADIAREGHLPLWNPYIFGGMPLHGAAQGGLLFPLNWFYLAFPPPAATNLMMLSTYAVAALGAYLYARRSGWGIGGAVVTSLAFQWSGFLIAQIGHTNVVQVAALLPWLLWAVDGYGATGRRGRGLLVAAVACLQALAGHQQTLVYSLLLAAAYALVMQRAARPARSRHLWAGARAPSPGCRVWRAPSRRSSFRACSPPRTRSWCLARRAPRGAGISGRGCFWRRGCCSRRCKSYRPTS